MIYSHGYPTGRYNLIQTLKACRGKYIAICEGDDYWHNPEKIRKQAEFMEQHPEYSMCNSDYDYLNLITDYSIPDFWKAGGYAHDEELDIASLLLSEQYIVRTPTVMIRRDYTLAILEEHAEDFDERYRLADSQLWFHLSRAGKVKYFNESMATYRCAPNSSTSMNNMESRYDFIENVYWHKRSFAERDGYTEAIPMIDRIYLSQLNHLAVLAHKAAEAREYAGKMTAQSLWRPSNGLLRLAATYGNVFAVCYRELVRMLYWLDRRTGKLGGRLRVLLGGIRWG